MEKKIIIHTAYTALAILLTLSSCVQEEPGKSELQEEGNRIYFRTYLPTVTQTRAGVISKENLTECRVTCINPDGDNLIDPVSGTITPYFSDIPFEKHADGHFLAEAAAAASTIWPDSKSTLHFFAYYPSAESMQASIDGEKFNLVNYSVKKDGSPVIDYRLESFRVAPDIADQVDFITAYSTGTQKENSSAAIDLKFTHQLARIEISAWGASEKYDFEIAGVRIGNPLTQGDFNFSSIMSASGATNTWLNTAGHRTPVEHIFSEGESIVFLSKESQSHASAENAASIMGNAGPAMVIPMDEKIEAWEGKEDPDIEVVPYTTDKLYFSLLIRVTNRHNETVYPYPNNCDLIPVTYLAVGKEDNKVIRRVYMIDGQYYTANEKSDDLKYTPGDDEDIRGFCWASLPVSGGAKWEAGKIYTYKLNYTNGIGWQDPADPTPGEPIIERGMVPFEVGVEEWVAAEDHDPNIDVPKR